jgi:hypothetical protein
MERKEQAFQLTIGHRSGSNYRISIDYFRLYSLALSLSFTQGCSLQVNLTET